MLWSCALINQRRIVLIRGNDDDHYQKVTLVWRHHVIVRCMKSLRRCVYSGRKVAIVSISSQFNPISQGDLLQEVLSEIFGDFDKDALWCVYPGDDDNRPGSELVRTSWLAVNSGGKLIIWDGHWWRWLWRSNYFVTTEKRNTSSSWGNMNLRWG